MTTGFAKITDEMVQKLRDRVGPGRPGRNPWNETASRDGIKHWAWGIGDDNPLWVDQEYASKTKWGGIVAPPTFLYSTSTGPLGPGSHPSRGSGLPGIHGLHTGDSWELFEPIRLGDRIHHDRETLDPIEKRSSYVGRMIQQNHRTRYYNQDNKIVAVMTGHAMATERGTPKEYGKYQGIEMWRYSDDELKMIADQYASEKPRGQTPLDWNTVKPGLEIPKRLKGPLTTTSMITYLMGWGSPFCMTDRIAHEYMRNHPGANVQDGPTNIPDFPERAHWDEWLYREIGFPLGYDIGTQRISWFGHLLTDWVGDDGFVNQLTVIMREPNWMYDLTWLRGRVIEANVVDGQPKVRLELWGESQRGNTHTRGEAAVTLGNVINVR